MPNILETFPHHIEIRSPKNRFPLVKGPCWIWVGETVQGYGSVNFGGVTWRAHRLSMWLSKRNKLFPGWFACHMCDVRPCCNHGHLFAGTNDQNMADIAKWAILKNRDGKLVSQDDWAAFAYANSLENEFKLVLNDLYGFTLPISEIERTFKRNHWRQRKAKKAMVRKMSLEQPIEIVLTDDP